MEKKLLEVGVDVVEMIVKLVQLKDEPSDYERMSLEEGDQIIGYLPLHLRQVHALMQKLQMQLLEDERVFLIATSEGDDKAVYDAAVKKGFSESNFEAVNRVFFVAMCERYLNDETMSLYSNVKICQNWEVVGVIG